MNINAISTLKDIPTYMSIQDIHKTKKMMPHIQELKEYILETSNQREMKLHKTSSHTELSDMNRPWSDCKERQDNQYMSRIMAASIRPTQQQPLG